MFLVKIIRLYIILYYNQLTRAAESIYRIAPHFSMHIIAQYLLLCYCIITCARSVMAKVEVSSNLDGAHHFGTIHITILYTQTGTSKGQ